VYNKKYTEIIARGNKGMLKFDMDEFDKILESELSKDEECSILISRFKQLISEDDASVNLLIIKIFEIAYQSGFKSGMNFIIKRNEIDLFR
jgi:hypothetical protein